jgi:very-short-patch-repair endonuclease
VSPRAGDSAGVDRVFRWIRRAGLPSPVLGFRVMVAGRRRLVDLAYPAEKIAVEFNGWEFHRMRSRMDADQVRTTELELAGWLVIVVTAAHTEAATIDRIRRALALRSPASVLTLLAPSPGIGRSGDRDTVDRSPWLGASAHGDALCARPAGSSAHGRDPGRLLGNSGDGAP